MVKNPPANAEDTGSIPDLEGFPMLQSNHAREPHNKSGHCHEKLGHRNWRAAGCGCVKTLNFYKQLTDLTWPVGSFPISGCYDYLGFSHITCHVFRLVY